MQQFDALRKRVNPGNEWFRIGLASATVLAPLLKRWTDLRDTDSTRALRAEAEARWNDARSRFALSNLPGVRRKPLDVVGDVTESVTRRNSNVARIWLVGVGVGLVAAGAGAYFFVQRRMNSALDEPLVDLPVASSNGHSAGTSRDAGAAQPAQPASSGAGAVTSAPAQTAAAGVNGTGARERAAAQTSEAQAGAGTGAEQAAPRAAEPVIREPGELPGGGTTVTESGAPAGVVDASEAPFIGNIRTMVYHEADDENLPAEENRIYFASEDEAREAGYRRDREDAPAASSEAGTEAAREAGGTGI